MSVLLSVKYQVSSLFLLKSLNIRNIGHLVKWVSQRLKAVKEEGMDFTNSIVTFWSLRDNSIWYYTEKKKKKRKERRQIEKKERKERK